MIDNDLPARGKCEWCPDTDGVKRKRADGSVVYQCWRHVERVPLSA